MDTEIQFLTLFHNVVTSLLHDELHFIQLHLHVSVTELLLSWEDTILKGIDLGIRLSFRSLAIHKQLAPRQCSPTSSTQPAHRYPDRRSLLPDPRAARSAGARR